MTGSHSYRHLTRETNEDTTSSYSDHQHTPDRKPEQLPYTKDGGTSSTTTPEQENHTLESNDSTSTNSTEKVSHQTTNLCPNHQMRNQQCPDPSQRTPATKNQRSATHQILSKNLHHLQHQSPATHTTEEDPESYRHQTNTALASLLLARNNNQPQQIWRLRLLQLQQQQLLSDLAPHQSTQLLLHRLPPRLHNELRAIYRPLYREPLEDLADLAALETLADLANLEAPEDQDNQEETLLLQQPQPLPLQPPTMTTDLWAVYPKHTREIENLPEHFSISLPTTSGQIQESQD
jgi:hypothetical protein